VKGPTKPTADDFLKVGRRVRVLPIVHGSGDFAIRAREELLARPYDCVAVPLPASFQDDVEAAIDELPKISVVVRRDGEDGEGFNYVPIDPCQGVIAAIRTARGERIAREFIDLDTATFEANTAFFPDPYALKRVTVERFAAAVLPSVVPPSPGQHEDRIAHMAAMLHELERRYRSILFVCSLLDWPWIRDAYQLRAEPPEPEFIFAPVITHTVDPKTLLFLFGELPFITALYERGRSELLPDDNLSVEGVKELVLHARDRLKRERPKLGARITPQLLAVYFRYVRNLSLVEQRLTPDLYTLIIAAKQTAGDDFALAVAETAREFPCWTPGDFEPHGESRLRMGIGQADVPVFGLSPMVTRLPGHRISWRECELLPRPADADRTKWRQRWDPLGMCSWPPEDDRIESFQNHVRDQAKAILGEDLAKSEKFTASVMDGIDVRETLRNWHTGDLYVKLIPPSRGSIEVVIFLFDLPADPATYTHRMTWYAEHSEESTLAFFSTNPMKDLVGPGIARAEYGGAMFIYPPRPIPDVWEDTRLDFAHTLEDRLVAAGLLHSKERHVALVAPTPLTQTWRKLARKYRRALIHLPLKRFSGQTIDRLRQFHVLNGKQVRSYAADFIRDL
jgi:hypothetical protein